MIQHNCTVSEHMRACLESCINSLSAMATNTSVLLLITLWASVQDGFGLPSPKQLEVEASGGAPTHRERTKRCACSNLLDSECHFFCHLDIIWVNTPGKTTVYGLGSFPSRRRRSTGRCTCANPGDQSCATFCHHSPQITSPKRSLKRHQLNFLSILSILRRPDRAPEAADSGEARKTSAR